MLTLWDLLDPLLNKIPVRAKPPALPAVRVVPQQMVEPPPREQPPAKKRATKPRVKEGADAGMQAKYDAVVAQMLEKYEIRVRKWRTSMSGIAWYVTYRDGRVQRLIEAPKPKGPMSAAIFLHEIGHHAIGFDVYKPRCLEEYHAWRWSLEAMEAHGLNITDPVRERMYRSLWYAVQKAKRRGIKKIPDELMPFVERPNFPRRRGRRRS